MDSTVDTGGNFEGSLFHLTIFPDALDIHQHDCLYQQMEATVATCSAVNEPSLRNRASVASTRAARVRAARPSGARSGPTISKTAS